MKHRILLTIFVGSALALSAYSAPSAPDSPAAGARGKVRYKQSDDVNFEKLLIEGQLQKPSVTVVTGTVKKGGDGLLRLRKNFLDRVARDFGEKAE